MREPWPVQAERLVKRSSKAASDKKGRAKHTNQIFAADPRNGACYSAANYLCVTSTVDAPRPACAVAEPNGMSALTKKDGQPNKAAPGRKIKASTAATAKKRMMARWPRLRADGTDGRGTAIQRTRMVAWRLRLFGLGCGEMRCCRALLALPSGLSRRPSSCQALMTRAASKAAVSSEL